ncbi:MAG: hypothetical protein WBB33_03160 [Candidatus Saccharimonadales bacterium]
MNTEVGLSAEEAVEFGDKVPEYTKKFYKDCLAAMAIARKDNDMATQQLLAGVIADVEKQYPHFVVDDDGRTTERDW